MPFCSRVVASGSAARDYLRREVVMIDETDRRIVGDLAAMLTGAELVTEEELLARELDVALKLVVLPANQARMRHMLATNKPLEN